MKARLLVRKIHRYVALVVGLQLLLWSVGGLYFSLVPIQRIHGDHLLNRAPLFIQRAVSDQSCLPAASVLTKILDTANEKNMSRLIVAQSPLMTYVQIKKGEGSTKYDFCQGEPLPLLTKQSIRSAAAAVTIHAGSIESVQLINRTSADHEYRGGSLPAYRVSYDGSENLHLYLDAKTGAVTSARTTPWRIFDFLWMLHVMDYEERDDFNHWLLQLFAAFAVVTSSSGLLLWWMSRRRKKSLKIRD